MSFAIGIEKGKDKANVAGLWRSAYNFGASMIFTIGFRYRYEPADTYKTARHIPLVQFPDWRTALALLPDDWAPVVVELCDGAESLITFKHPRSAVYILGPEDGNVSDEIQAQVLRKILIPTHRCLNVAVTGAVVMYDRLSKQTPCIKTEN